MGEDCIVLLVQALLCLGALKETKIGARVIAMDIYLSLIHI